MKKVIGSLLLSLFVVVFLPSCGGGDTDVGGAKKGNTDNAGTSDSGSNANKTPRIELPDGYKLAKDGTPLYNSGEPVDLANAPKDIQPYLNQRKKDAEVNKTSSDGTNIFIPTT